MDHLEVGRYWDQNAPTWTRLSRSGYDVYRDLLNTPAFLDLLPDVAGRRGLDLGCGEGHNTRLLAGRGAAMAGIDIAAAFVRAAAAEELRHPCDIRYLRASAAALPFADAAFDFGVAFMSLMDMPEQERVLGEIARVLCPGGFLQFSIEHPLNCSRREWVRDESGRQLALTVSGYFDVGEELDTWLFGTTPAELRATLPPFRVPRFRRTLSQWINAIAAAGLAIEAAAEPAADESTARAHPEIADSRIVPLFLQLRCRKPSST